MKKRLLLWALLSFTAATRLDAQDYNWGIGVRGGIVTSSVSVKYNFDPVSSFEGMVDFAKGFNIIALYERNLPVIGEGFRFYYGFGANIGSWHKYRDEFTLGIDGIVGLEYKIPSVPLAFSVDYKPFLNLVGHTKFHADDFGLTVKVAF